MREFLEFIIRDLIEFPDDMVLTEIPNGRMITFKLQLRRGDVGRVIGRSGQTIHAIRALLASSAARHGQRAVLDIVEYVGAIDLNRRRSIISCTVRAVRVNRPYL